MKYNEIKGFGATEVDARVLELKQELAKERALVASGTRSENPGKIKKLRRDIARLLTVKNQKKEDGK